MDRALLVTKDGSHTVIMPSLNVTYHSMHGAVQESKHVFIDAGLNYQWSVKNDPTISVLEVGFGTGLNALLTCSEAASRQRKISYTALEPYPLTAEITKGLNYEDASGYLAMIHNAVWGAAVNIHEYFRLTKLKISLAEADAEGKYDLVYFDAFDPGTQPAIWSAESFEKIYSMMKPGGVLTTYCSKSHVRKTMMSVGFKVTKIQGPRGKREMVRAERRLDQSE